MRGKDVCGHAFDVVAGITPAYAGKRRKNRKTALPHEDHPRVCGEKLTNPTDCPRQAGSPPRMRGKVDEYIHDKLWLGITPAHAGKSSLSMWSVCCCRDHPRACGEKTFLSWWKSDRLGSPPRMRGKGLYAYVYDGNHRITPAHAGKRCVRPVHRRGRWDHPRACGEKKVGSPPPNTKKGSPPRMRGKGRSAAAYQGAQGITPAHAGKSADGRDHRCGLEDHPRACGEKGIEDD